MTFTMSAPEFNIALEANKQRVQPKTKSQQLQSFSSRNHVHHDKNVLMMFSQE